jgi:hypothetical protein
MSRPAGFSKQSLIASGVKAFGRRHFAARRPDRAGSGAARVPFAIVLRSNTRNVVCATTPVMLAAAMFMESRKVFMAPSLEPTRRWRHYQIRGGFAIARERAQ